MRHIQKQAATVLSGIGDVGALALTGAARLLAAVRVLLAVRGTGSARLSVRQRLLAVDLRVQGVPPH